MIDDSERYIHDDDGFDEAFADLCDGPCHWRLGDGEGGVEGDGIDVDIFGGSHGDGVPLRASVVLTIAWEKDIDFVLCLICCQK